MIKNGLAQSLTVMKNNFVNGKVGAGPVEMSGFDLAVFEDSLNFDWLINYLEHDFS